MTGDYQDRARRAIDEAFRELAANLDELEQTTHAVVIKEGGDIGPTIYSLGEAYRNPTPYTVSTLASCLDAFLKMRESKAEAKR